MTVADLRKIILELYPVLSTCVPYVVAVNHEIADEFTPIDEEDEIAILPPVSGG
jgi:sulfur-carrier protein